MTPAAETGPVLARAPDVVIAPVTEPDIGLIALTFSAHRTLLAAKIEERVAVGAWIDGVAIGLALGYRIAHMDEAGGPVVKLLSLMVAGPYRRQGIGAALLRRFEAAAAACGVPAVYAVYSTRLPARAAFERAVSAAGWIPPRFKELRLTGECGKMIEAVAAWPALEGRLLHAGRYAFTPWVDVGGAADGAAIECLCQQPACARATLIQPHVWERHYDRAISIAVRRDGALVGWVAAHRMEAPEGQPAKEAAELYYVSYLDAALQRSGIMVAAYFRAFERQASAFGARSIALYSALEPAMVAVTRRRFAPIARWTDELHITAKRFPEAPPQPPVEAQPR